MHHDESTNLEQFVDDFVEIRDLIESDSFDNFQYLSLRYAERTLEKTRIKRSRDVVKFDRRRCRKENTFEHFRFFVKCLSRQIVKLENEHFEHFARLMTFILRSLDESSQTRECFDDLVNFLTKIDALCLLNDFLLAIVNFSVKRQIVRISWRDHRRRSLRVSLIVALHCSFQNDLTCRLKIARDTIISTTDRRNFCISFTQKSISRAVIDDCNVSACFIAFLILFKLMSFHALRAIRERFDFVSQKIFVEMRIWFDDWSRSNRVMQCFHFFVKWIVMNVRFMMLIELRAFHVIEFLDRVRMRLRFCIMSNKSSVATCCVERNESLQKKWWRVKFFNNMWWSSSASTMNRMIFDNVNELSFDVYEISDELYTLCMRIIFVFSRLLWRSFWARWDRS